MVAARTAAPILAQRGPTTHLIDCRSEVLGVPACQAAAPGASGHELDLLALVRPRIADADAIVLLHNTFGPPVLLSWGHSRP